MRHNPSFLHQRTPAIPIELIHDIVREAWALYPTGGSKLEWGERWEFYNNISLVSKQWAAVMTSVALRRITIQCANDFAFYRRLIIRERGADPNSKDVERVHPSARDFFAQSTLHIALADLEWKGGSGSMWRTDYARIPHYVPSCRYIDCITREFPTDNRFYAHPYDPLLDLLKQYDRTLDVRFAWTYEHNKHYMIPEPRPQICNVTYLRLHLYPRCVCHKIQTSPMANGPNGTLVPLIVPPPAHINNCFSYYLPTLFPDLRHLHIDTPYFLKNVTTPPSLQILTIEAPPIHFMTGLGYYSSLAAWNIVSAVSAGLLWSSTGDSKRHRKLVVNAGPKEPPVWKQTCAICKEHGVELELNSIYEPPSDEPK